MGIIAFNRNIKEGWNIVNVTDSNDNPDMCRVLEEYNNILLDKTGMLILHVDNGVDTDKYFITKRVRNMRIIGEAIMRINYYIEPHQTWISKYLDPETTNEEREYMKEVYSKHLYKLNPKYNRVSTMQFGWKDCELMHRVAINNSGIPIKGDDSDYVTLSILRFMSDNNYKLLYGNYSKFLPFLGHGYRISVYQICQFAEAIDFNEDLLKELDKINNKVEDYIQVITKYPYEAEKILALDVCDVYTLKWMLVMCESNKEVYRYEDMVRCLKFSADYKECYAELKLTSAHNLHHWYYTIMKQDGLEFLYDAAVWYHKMYDVPMEDIIAKLNIDYIFNHKDEYSTKQLIKMSCYNA